MADENGSVVGEELKKKIAEILASSDEDREKIRKLHELGYSQVQLWREFGFAKATVYDELPVRQLKEKQPESEEGKTDDNVFPLVLKDGKGETLSPEAVYHRLVAADGIDGERDFKALMKWAAAIELVQRMSQIRKGEAEAFASTVKPMLDMMEKSRQELDAAAARAKESSMEIAEAAAAGAAARATMHIDEKFDQLKELKKEKADIATVQDPMKGLMARTMETMMNRMQSMLFGSGGGGEVSPTPGLIDKRGQK